MTDAKKIAEARQLFIDTTPTPEVRGQEPPKLPYDIIDRVGQLRGMVSELADLLESHLLDAEKLAEILVYSIINNKKVMQSLSNAHSWKQFGDKRRMRYWSKKSHTYFTAAITKFKQREE